MTRESEIVILKKDTLLIIRQASGNTLLYSFIAAAVLVIVEVGRTCILWLVKVLPVPNINFKHELTHKISSYLLSLSLVMVLKVLNSHSINFSVRWRLLFTVCGLRKLSTQWSDLFDWPAVGLQVHLIFSLACWVCRFLQFRHMQLFKMETQCLPGSRAAESSAPTANSTKQIFKKGTEGIGFFTDNVGQKSI